MKTPRVTMRAILLIVVLIAVDFALLRAGQVGRDLPYWWELVVVATLPMVNALAMVGYRAWAFGALRCPAFLGFMAFGVFGLVMTLEPFLRGESLVLEMTIGSFSRGLWTVPPFFRLFAAIGHPTFRDVYVVAIRLLAVTFLTLLPQATLAWYGGRMFRWYAGLIPNRQARRFGGESEVLTAEIGASSEAFAGAQTEEAGGAGSDLDACMTGPLRLCSAGCWPDAAPFTEPSVDQLARRPPEGSGGP